MIDERTQLASEVAELKRIIENTPSTRLLEKRSFESRLDVVQARLDTLPETAPKPPPVRLTFKGKPVRGRAGIDADFGAKVLTQFSSLFAAIAAGYAQIVQDAGPLPGRNLNRLLITGTAVGSFGFEFELPKSREDVGPSQRTPDQISFLEETDVEEPAPTPEDAMNLLETILRTTVGGSDDEVTDILSDVNQRAIKYAHEFMVLLAQNEATCRVSFGRRAFEFQSVQELREAADRIKPEKIQPGEREFSGQFIGLLPRKREFEFILSDRGESVLRGKIGPNIETPKLLREWLEKPVTVKLKELRVGRARPSYTLESFEDILRDEKP